MQCTHYSSMECKMKMQKENDSIFHSTENKKAVSEQKYMILKRGITAGLDTKRESMSLCERFYFLLPSLRVALDLEKWPKKYLIVKNICLRYFFLTLPKLQVLASFYSNPPAEVSHSVSPLQRLVQIQFREKQNNIAPDKQHGYSNCQIHQHHSSWYILTQGPELTTLFIVHYHLYFSYHYSWFSELEHQETQKTVSELRNSPRKRKFYVIMQ